MLLLLLLIREEKLCLANYNWPNWAPMAGILAVADLCAAIYDYLNKINA